MAITFHCEACGKRFDVDEGLAGKRGKCKQCGLIFIIPGASPPTRSPRSSSRPVPPPPPRSFDPPPKVHDPYGLAEDDDPPPLRPIADDFDDDEVVPRRAGIGVKPAKSRPRSEPVTIAGLPGWGFLLLAGLVAVGAAFLCTQVPQSLVRVIVPCLMIVALILSIGGNIGGLVVAFRESVSCGLMSMFVPFYGLYYLITRWDTMKKPFIISLGGTEILLGFALFLPAFAAGQAAANRARLNNERLAAGRAGNAAAPLPLAPPGQESEHERRLRELISVANEAADLYDSVQDARSLLRVQARINLADARCQMLIRGPLFASSPGEAARLKAAYAEPLRNALTRLDNSIKRVRALANIPPGPPIYLALADGSPDVERYFAPGPGTVPVLPQGRPVASSPSPSAGPGGPLTVVVSGITDRETARHVGSQIVEILSRVGGRPWRSKATEEGDRITYRINPVRDPQEFARQITFGKVEQASDGMIHVIANPLSPEQRRPPAGETSLAAGGAQGGEMGPNDRQQPAASDPTSQIVVDLRSPDLQTRKDALGRLMRGAPDDRREEVAQAIEPMLKDPDGFGRADAAKALAVWGGPENTPALLEALKDREFYVRWAVLDTLKALKDPESADALADYLMNSNDRGKAAEALRAIGRPAEAAVLKCLAHSDGFVRMDACKILGEIGTSKSLKALRRIAQANAGLDSMAARDALRQIGNGRGR